MSFMYLLKLLIVPAFLALITLAARRWGPGVAGMLAGFPVVAGPILYFISLEQGSPFAADAAKGSLLAVAACVAFGVVFTICCKRLHWISSLLLGWIAWLAVAALLSISPIPLIGCAALAALAAVLGRLVLSPSLTVSASPVPMPITELVSRMAAGALLVVAVTTAASTVGTRWAGLFAMFPVLGSVLGVFSLRRNGPAYVSILFRSMFLGFLSFATFCTAVSLLLQPFPPAAAFSIAVMAALAVQGIVVWVVRRLMPMRQAAVASRSET